MDTEAKILVACIAVPVMALVLLLSAMIPVSSDPAVPGEVVTTSFSPSRTTTSTSYNSAGGGGVIVTTHYTPKEFNAIVNVGDDTVTVRCTVHQFGRVREGDTVHVVVDRNVYGGVAGRRLKLLNAERIDTG